MRTLCLICISLCAGLSSKAQETIGRIAGIDANQGTWEQRALALEFAAYQSEQNSERVNALLQKSITEMGAGQTEKAYRTAQRFQFFDISDSLQYETRYQLAFTAFLNKDFEGCESQLLQIEQFLPDMSLKTYPLYALTLNEQRKWDEAKMKLTRWVDEAFSEQGHVRDSLLNHIESMYKVKNYPKLKNKRHAETWSTILPGTGQLYAGYIFDAAFTALMVASGLGIIAYGVLVAKYYVSGVIVGYSFFQRFYAAGIKRSIYLAEKRNHKNLRKFNEPLIKFITALPEKVGQ